MKLSIIIPYYNILKELDRCLKSLSEQTIIKDYFEVLVIDSCSLIKPDSIIKKYKNKLTNLKVFKLRKNQGPGIARNLGIKKSLGEYIFFLDADDILPNHSLKKIYKLILEKNVDIITFNWSYLNKKKYVLKRLRKDHKYLTFNKIKLIKTYISMHYNLSVIFCVSKKNIFIKNNIKFPSGLHEDIAVLFQMYFFATKIYYTNEILYLKENRKGSIVNTFSPKHINDFFKSWVTIKDIIIKNKSLTFFNNHLIKFYIKGILGLLSMVIIKNRTINKNIKSKKYFYYGIIAKEFKKFYLKDIQGHTLPYKTKYDQISSIFLKYYLFEKKKYIYKRNQLYEKEILQKKLLSS
jgi:glycosyltransferase involved in cell wall biosynthesis